MKMFLSGWAGKNQHGEADFLCPLCSREAGSHWSLFVRETDQRCGQAPIRVRDAV